jgi:large conductance mechanosensitive channel
MIEMSNEDIQNRILEELKGLRADLAPAPPAPLPPEPEKPKGFLSNFIYFLENKGIIGLAVAVIIGGAAGKLVSAMVTDILMPIVTFFIPGGAWRTYELTIGPIVLLVGDFAGVIIDFFIISLVVYILMKQVEKIGLK